MNMTKLNVLLAAGLLLAVLPAGAQEIEATKREPPVVDLAICLDTSGSMSGLINSARTKIWAIVNDLALAKPTPRLRVALLTYGNSGHDQAKGWVFVHTDLTEDLDLISSKLFALTTNGGTEYVGRVLQTALRQLSWQKDPNGLKLMVVAGNESADQDKEAPFRDVCRKVIASGIMVNSIYCVRSEDPSIADGWKEVAQLTDGHYAPIDQDHGTVTIATPYDARLNELMTAINDTYVPFGAEGEKGKMRQKAEDANAKKLAPAAVAGRAQTKAGLLYMMRWCLVDATRNDKIKLEDVKQEELPKELRGKTVEELQKYLDAKWAARNKIQKEVDTLHRQRADFVAEELKRQAKADDKSFDAAVRRAIRTQAEKKGFEFEE
jgi:hypothetical protein